MPGALPGAAEAPGQSRDEQVCLGVVAGARGLKGEVWIRTFTADPAAVAAYGPLADAEGRRRFTLRIVAAGADRVLACIDGIGDRTQAEALKGTRLYVPRQALPPPGEDEFYHADLIGLAVRFVAAPDNLPSQADPPPGTGRVTAVHDHGGGAILEIIPGGGGEPLLVPFSHAAVPEIDLGSRQLVVMLLPGLLATATDDAALGGLAGRGQ